MVARTKRRPVKQAILTPDDERWFAKMRSQQEAADPFWTTKSDELYSKYARQWVVFDAGRIVYHSPQEEAMGRWLDQHDPRRERFLVSFVPDADAEFVFAGSG